MKQVQITMPRRALTLVCGLALSATAFAQQVIVKGHVKDSAGEPIIGAAVRVNGQSGGAVTDIDGNFSIKADKGATVTVSYVGYEQAQASVSNNMVITLQEDNQSLKEVVVIGYGVAKKSDLTGSVTALKPDSKNKGVVVNAQDLMQGKIAGVNVTGDSGEPGAGTQIRIRGGSSLNASNDPLVVIDGVPMDNNKVNGSANLLSTINPQDIESFNVLKDASATAIYGSRGSNGVIIITTKKGRAGQKPTVSYSGSLTVSSKKKTHDMMDGNEYRAFVKGIFGENSDPYKALGTANTDWQDLIYRTAVSHDHNLTVAGSVKDVLPYRVSVGYTGQQGILKTSKYDRYTASVNLNPSLLDNHLTLNLNAKGMYSENHKANTDAIGAAVDMDPTQDPYSFTSPYHIALIGGNMEQTLKNFGGYFEWPTPASALGDAQWAFTKHKDATKNPLAVLYGSDNKQTTRSFIGSADIDYKVHGFEDLRLHATLGLEVAEGKDKNTCYQFDPANMYYGGSSNNKNLKRNELLTTYAQYYKDINKNHHLDVMAGYEYQHFFFRYNNSWMQYYPATAGDNAGKVFNDQPDFDKYENFLVSFFGRANYILMNRYYLTATVRRDGSSRFQEHWGTFPSFAFAYKIKEEKPLRDLNWLSDLKLRLGYGVTGQQEGIDNYLWIAQYRVGGPYGYYPMAGDGKLYTPKYFNKNLKWETTTTYNVGLDFGAFDQRVTASVDWYYRKTKDLINNAPVAALSGFADMGLQNIGSLKNTGVEVALGWKVVQTKDWFWSLDYNFTYNKNEITDLTGVSEGGLPVLTGANIDQSNKVLAHQVGYAANSFYVYQQVYDQNGRPIEGCVVDRNGDGEITEGDRYLYKNIAAPVTMGLSSRLEYKNWDFGFTLRASIGNYVYNNFDQAKRLTSENAIWAQSAYLPNRPLTSLFWQSDHNTSKLTDLFVQNASFLKCDNITLGYSFNNLFVKGFSGRVYATASNVFTITKYDGIDPEVGSGIDNNLYPRPFSFIFGLNLNF